ncbi:HXXEE domain-containing protein [Corynebacterium terpenotabidum]|uniref:HXXEE domain-containing protein n=1 Tax=Corynebacterium terpenotabidum Y-11 TaxID=1200352 RepID=S4X9Y6_9CORY|nr:HXXEE domain-containing protein [Corynebacterium terpenotabidum]AGP29932.1 hypothetical protein A606_01385 [Corynebacterium terpenotabidum Y-11]
MKWYIHNWYHLAAIALVALTFIMGLWGYDQVSTTTLILIYSFMALLAHQSEEYVVPGGAQIILNAAFYGETKDYDRYPGNAFNASIVNTSAYVFYGLAIIFPQFVWLGLATMFFGFFQVLGHGLQMNIKSKGWYNPGLATAVFLHLPIGIYYIAHVHSENLIVGTDYLWGAIAFVVAIALTVVLPVQGTKKRDNVYPFTPEELNKFHMLDKLKSRGVI